MADNKQVEFDTANEGSGMITGGAQGGPVVQKIINPMNGLLMLVILIILCLMVPVLFISGATAWHGGGIRILLALLLCIVLPFLFGGLRRNSLRKRKTVWRLNHSRRLRGGHRFPGRQFHALNRKTTMRMRTK